MVEGGTPELADRGSGAQSGACPAAVPRGVPQSGGPGYVTWMTRRFSLGWASLVAWMLFGLVPTGTPRLEARTDRSFRPAERGQSPLGTTPTPPTDPRFTFQSPRQGWPLDAALPANPFALAVRFLIVPGPSVGAIRPAPRTPVAFPLFPTGPPVLS